MHKRLKKGLRMAIPPEIEVPNDVGSGAIFQVIPPRNQKATPTTEDSTAAPLAPQPSEDLPSVRPKTRQPSISTASTSSEQSYL